MQGWQIHFFNISLNRLARFLNKCIYKRLCTKTKNRSTSEDVNAKKNRSSYQPQKYLFFQLAVGTTMAVFLFVRTCVYICVCERVLLEFYFSKRLQDFFGWLQPGIHLLKGRDWLLARGVRKRGFSSWRLSSREVGLKQQRLWRKKEECTKKFKP